MLAFASAKALQAEDITIEKIIYELDESDHTAEVYGVVRDLGFGGKTSSITNANIRASITFRGESYRVTSIRKYAFLNCTRLTTANIPNSIQTIGESAFAQCGTLTSVSIFAKEIGTEAFESCPNLQNVILGEGVTKIKEGAFKRTAINTITIPNSVTSIEKDAFYYSKLQSIKIGCGLNTISSNAFAGTNLKEFIIPKNVICIRKGAFADCKSLTKIVIHNKVTRIEAGAFSNCTSLQTFDMANDNPHYMVVDNVLFDKNQSYLLQYPSGKKNSTYTIPNGVVLVTDYAFENIPSLRTIQIPNSVEEIGCGNFSNCKNLETIKIGNHVKKIGGYVCRHCANLADFIIPNSVEEIGECAFEYCRDLISIVLPGSVQFVGSLAFADCPDLIVKVPYHTECHSRAFARVAEIKYYHTTNPIEEREKIRAQQEQERKERAIRERKAKEENERKKREQREKEKKNWYMACRANTIESYQKYIADGGEDVNSAYSKIDSLYWNQACKTDEIGDYREYLSRNTKAPKEYVDYAQKRIEVIKRQNAIIAEAETIKDKQKAFGKVQEARRLGKIQYSILKRALVVEEPYAYKKAKSKDATLSDVEWYLSTYSSVAPNKHISGVKGKQKKLKAKTSSSYTTSSSSFTYGVPQYKGYRKMGDVFINTAVNIQTIRIYKRNLPQKTFTISITRKDPNTGTQTYKIHVGPKHIECLYWEFTGDVIASAFSHSVTKKETNEYIDFDLYGDACKIKKFPPELIDCVYFK